MRGQIRKRGKSYSVVVYNGKDAKGKKNTFGKPFVQAIKLRSA